MRDWLFIVMALAVGGMAWGVREYQDKGQRWGRPLAAILGAGVISGALALLWAEGTGRTDQVEFARIVREESYYRQLGMFRFGQYLAACYPGATAVLVTAVPEGLPDTAPEMAAVAMFKAGLGQQITLVATRNYPPEEDARTLDFAQAAEPGSLHVAVAHLAPSSRDWEIMLTSARYARPNLVISLAGLPLDIASISWWQRPAGERPTVAVAGCPMISSLYDEVASGRINVLLHANPPSLADMRRPFPLPPEEAFASRWRLFTPANLLAQDRLQPGLFYHATAKTADCLEVAATSAAATLPRDVQAE